MPSEKPVYTVIERDIAAKIDALQPSHFTRKAFINQLLLEAVEHRETKSTQALISVAE